MKVLWAIVIVFLVALSFSGIVFAHEEELSLTDSLGASSLNYIIIAAVIAGTLTIISVAKKKKSPRQNAALFLGIVIPVLLSTAFLAGSTIYLNLVSQSGGPVHWHADFEIWNCDQKLDLVDPQGFENRVGSPLFHEHGDNRIHIEGVVTDPEDVSLHHFFEFIGGYHDQNTLRIPTNNGIVEMKNGDPCNGAEGKLQGFLYRITNPDSSRRSGFQYQQQKIEDITNYVPAPYSNIPPGDCIILEFDQEKSRTDRICETYRLAVEKGELREGS